MKKSLIALAILGSVAGVAQAQSSVTLYGIVDVWAGRTKAEVPGVAREDIQVTVERDDSEERKGVYRLRTTLAITGAPAAASTDGIRCHLSSCNRYN